MRDPENFEMMWVDMSKVARVIVNESEGKRPEQYVIRDINPNFQNMTVAAKTTTDYMTNPVTGSVSGSANYTLTLPSSPPASAQSVLSIATTGAVTNAAPDSTITVTSTQIKVANSGITATQLATGAVTATKMGAANYAASSSTGNAYTIVASPTPTAVPALYSVFSAVTTRPMIIALDNDQSGTASALGSAGVWTIYFEVIGPSGTTEVANSYFSANMYPPVGGICGFYVPSVGVHTIQAYVTRTVSGSISISNTRLVVYQL